MRPSAFTQLVVLSLRNDLRQAASSIFGITVGVASLVFFVSLGLGVASVVSSKIFPADSRLIEVIPSRLSLGLLGGKIDAEAFSRLQSIDGVSVAYRKMSVRVPAVSIYNGDFFGKQLRIGLELVALGVDSGYVKEDVPIDRFVDPLGDDPVPAVVATRLLEIYNKTFAPVRSLPQLGPAMIVGFTLPVEFNRSYVAAAASGPTTKTSAQLVGVSPRGLIAGLTIPFDSAVRINRQSGVDSETLSGVALLARSPADVPQIVAAVKAMGFGVDDQEQRLAENVGAAVTIITTALALLSLLICVLAAFNISHALSASVRSREKELGIFRAIGASRRDIFVAIFGEAFVVGATGALAGCTVALGFSRASDFIAARWLPDFPFKPDSFFAVPWWLPLVGISLGIGASIAGALIPARRAAAVDPARVLAGQGG